MAHDSHVSARDARPASVDRAEERAWISFYERVDRDPALAIEIMALLDSEPDSKRRLLALYLSCKQSVRFHKAREARDRRIGELVRLLLRSLILQPLCTAGAIAARAADLIAACAPSGRAVARPASRSASKPAEPAADTVSRKVQRLLRASAQTERDDPPGPLVRDADSERSSTTTEGAAPTVALRR